MFKYSSRLFLTIILFLLNYHSIHGENGKFGEINLQIEGHPSKSLPIKQALLYRNVSISYDSTAIIQDKKSVHVLYYPQLEEGTHHVLRLIMGDEQDTTQNYFDTFFNLGDTIPDSLHWDNETGRVFFALNGKAVKHQPVSQNISGDIVFQDTQEEAVRGFLDMAFDMKMFPDDKAARHVEINGDFDVPVGEYREASIATAKSDKEKKEKYRRNLYLGIVFTVFIVAIFGFR